MKRTRRSLAGLLLLPLARLRGQGVASRGVKPTPRSKQSGLPFDAKFTDVASTAGLHEPVIYGATDRKTYILETMGCGAVFFDYDNDGWIDILLLCGTRLQDAPTCDQPAIQE